MNKINYKHMLISDMAPFFDDYHFRVTPRWHQYVSIMTALCEDLHSVAYFQGVGTGKTIAALLTTLIWKCKKILVVCPTSAFGAWERDINKATDYSYAFISGSGVQRLDILCGEPDICIINYEGLKSVYASLQHVDDSINRKWMIDNSSFVDNFDCAILDEAHKCTDCESLQSRIILELSMRGDFCIALTGTPLDKSMLDLFNIYKVIDLGESLGTNFFRYRNRYFTRHICYGSGKRKYYEWTLKPGAKEEILEKISGITISFNRKDCFDLPKGVPIERPIVPTDEFLNIQECIINNDEVVFGDIVIKCDSETVKSQKLVQATTGFMYYNDSDGIKRAYRLKTNPKLDALLDLVDDSGEKIVVVHRFTETALMIEEALCKKNIEFVAIRGNIDTNRQDDIRRFREDDNIRIMIMHPTCGAEGFDGTSSSVMVFFSSIASPRIREQCEGRIDRDGQVNRCTFIDLVLLNSPDSKINKNRDNRKSLVESVMAYMQGYREDNL